MRRPSPILTNVLAICAVLVPAALLSLAVYARPQMLDLATNADALLPADMIHDWLHPPADWHSLWRSFQWPRIPSLVPDLVIYATLQAMGGWRAAQLGYGWVSLAALAGLCGCIAPMRTRTAALAFLAITALVLCAEWPIATTAWHLHLFAPAYHSGPFILSVACLVLARQGGTAGRAAMVLLAAAGTFSDRMVVGTFLLPLLAAVAVMHRQGAMTRRDAARLALLAIAGCGLGLAADRLVFPQLLTRQADVPLTVALMARRAIAVLGTRSALFVILLNATVLLPLWRRRTSLGGAPALFWWVAAATAMVPSTLLAAGLWEDDGGQRYLSAVLWWPILLYAPIAAHHVGRHTAIASLATVVVVAAGLASATPRRHPLLAWQDSVAACLAPTGRTEGLADYWQARRITVASDWAIQVMQTGPRGNTRVWGNNPGLYTRSRFAAGKPPAFSFIVMQGLDAAAIRATYGAPSATLACPGSDVWLYDDPAAMRTALAAASPALLARGQAICVGPDRLYRRGGPLGAGPVRVTDDRQLSRPVTFGPNLDLHPGAWRVALHYRLQTSTPGQDRWLVNGQWGTLHLASTPLPPSGPGEAVSETDLTLAREIEAVEVPTYLAGTATLQITQACFTPR